ncbi:helix-turn-helix transcriptional regulator [Lentilitoribacter sp. Alg239-R112]|uniref:helix-turn-helix domain-containing protein n=1 Tax=Lentilitoribacter sp. Alg239-R112 TaxID=2305987 RepID=UPI0013A7019D|nr:helix-turn-helix transcriptional regulator [Lentilitoribacter sp. Alg239-R112]
METLATRVRQRRNELKLSQTALANLVGVKQQAIQKVESGQTERPRFILELARALQTTPEELSDFNGGIVSDFNRSNLAQNDEELILEICQDLASDIATEIDGITQDPQAFGKVFRDLLKNRLDEHRNNNNRAYEDSNVIRFAIRSISGQ